jgi:hypothetical protein
VLLITNGKNRGNAAGAAEDLRAIHGVQLFALAINSTAENIGSLTRLIGPDYASERLLLINSVDEISGDKLSFIRESLCGQITPSFELDTTDPHSTIKRDVTAVPIRDKVTAVVQRTTRHIRPTPLCKDGFLRPYMISVAVDISSRAAPQDFERVLAMISTFVQEKFGGDPHRIQLNFVAFGKDIQTAEKGLSVEQLTERLHSLKQTDGKESPQLSRAINVSVDMLDSNAISGVNKITLLVSSDGTTSDDLSNERLRDNHHIIAISVKMPTTDLLKTLTGSPTRVIHLSNWGTDLKELFSSWLAHAICEVSTTKGSPRKAVTKPTKVLDNTQPSDVKLNALSPHSLSVTWTCCTNTNVTYEIRYTPDRSIPEEKWPRLSATCRESFGKTIDHLPTNNEYTVCVVALQQGTSKAENKSCETISLTKETPIIATPEPLANISPCQCVCTDNGDAILMPSCSTTEAQRHLTTLPPAETGECPCRVKPQRGVCPSGYFRQSNMCIDVNECEQDNGGCSHGCVNTPGDYYCACPHGLMRDPAHPKICINVAGSFDRITELLAQYLHANSKSVDGNEVNAEGPQKFKAVVKTDDSKTLQFEWTYVPTAVRNALKWLL